MLVAEFDMSESLTGDFIQMLGSMLAAANESGMPPDGTLVIQMDKQSVEELHEALTRRHAN